MPVEPLQERGDSTHRFNGGCAACDRGEFATVGGAAILAAGILGKNLEKVNANRPQVGFGFRRRGRPGARAERG